MKPSGVIIDVGKGNFTDKGLEKASQLGIRTWRADIYPIISNMVNCKGNEIFPRGLWYI